LSIFPSSFYLFPSFSSEKKILARQEGRRKKKHPDFTDVSLRTLFKYLVALLHTYAPEDNKPYFKEELEIAEAFLAEIGERDVSQAELASLLETHSLEEPASDNTAKFLESGYFATPGKFRDADEFALPCVLDSDLAELETRIKAKAPYDGYMVNVPNPLKRFPAMNENRPAWLPKHIFVADHNCYHEQRGFRVE
jgi:CRISPR-associated endonuclease/helicase Cas3